MIQAIATFEFSKTNRNFDISFALRMMYVSQKLSLSGDLEQPQQHN